MDEWLELKLEEQREQFALEIHALRNTLIDIRKHLNRIDEYKKHFYKDDKPLQLLEMWKPYIKDIFEVSDKYKG